MKKTSLTLSILLLFAGGVWGGQEEAVEMIVEDIEFKKMTLFANPTINKLLQIRLMKEGRSELNKETPYKPAPSVMRSWELIQETSRIFNTSPNTELYMELFTKISRYNSSIARHCIAIEYIISTELKNIEQPADINRLVFSSVIAPVITNNEFKRPEFFSSLTKLFNEASELIIQYQDWLLATEGFEEDRIKVEDSNYVMQSYNLCKELADKLDTEQELFEGIYGG